VFQTTVEIDRAIAKIRRRIEEIERLRAERVSHRDAAVQNVEHNVRDTIREEFGEGSSQFDRHRYFEIDDGPKYAMGFHESEAGFDSRGQQQFAQRIPGAITRLEGLIQQLEERRADLAVPGIETTVDEESLDALVGLPTRRGLEREFAARTTDPAEPLCLILFDIDRFKSVNDDHGGHTTGDEALVSVADLARTCVKGKGTAFRFGGDEFALLLPNHSLHEGLATAERFRRAVEMNNPGGSAFSIATVVGLDLARAPIPYVSSQLQVGTAWRGRHEIQSIKGELQTDPRGPAGGRFHRRASRPHGTSSAESQGRRAFGRRRRSHSARVQNQRFCLPLVPTLDRLPLFLGPRDRHLSGRPFVATGAAARARQQIVRVNDCDRLPSFDR
jgi:diguanylate cyclase (GGDEF)-like protein